MLPAAGGGTQLVNDAGAPFAGMSARAGMQGEGHYRAIWLTTPTIRCLNCYKARGTMLASTVLSVGEARGSQLASPGTDVELHAGPRMHSEAPRYGGSGIRTHEVSPPAGFQDRCIQPLCHPSNCPKVLTL